MGDNGDLFQIGRDAADGRKMKLVYYSLEGVETGARAAAAGRFCSLQNKLLGLLIRVLMPNGLRVWLGRKMGLRIGKNVYLGKYCVLDDTFPDRIIIEDEVNISYAVIILAHDAASCSIDPVLIKRGAFIGAGAILLPGVTIGEKAIVGAGSVVVSDIGDAVKAAGVPAKPLV
jgi:acetyltransferase-like isoleucine patch superfamily enzyme